MSNEILCLMDFARYQRWLDRAAGHPTCFMVLGKQGDVVWGEGRAQAAEIGRTIAATGDAAEGVHRIAWGDSQMVLYKPLVMTGVGQMGWSAILVDSLDDKSAPPSLDHLVEAFDDLSIGIADEYRQKSELRSMTEELGSRYEELHLVYSVDRHVQAQTRKHDGVFHDLLHSAAEHLNADVVAFVRPSKDICQYATNLSKEIHNLDLVLVEMRGDLFRFIQASRDSLVINEAADPRRAYIFTDMPYKILACPMHVDGRVDSIVVLINHMHKKDFSNSDRNLTEILANQLSSLSNMHLLLEGMREFNQQLAMTLIEAVEAKDPYTRGHSDRVHHLSMEIGRAMGLPEDELEDLHWGSLLHDVGKIGIPDAVLCKPSRLSKDEYTFIMVHPERSYEILRHVKHLEKAVLGARHHQEMYDGKGYPHGLKGNNIPLHGRIIAVADTYDSITSSRAYRAGRSHEVAMKEIARVAGSQLDPAIVEVFQNIAAAEPEWLKRFQIRRDAA
ncbi:MAG: HD domain-containing protein [Proteobacteria bacterium]|nr:HD domain-containing protein [Pseudomonadota bacterium]